MSRLALAVLFSGLFVCVLSAQVSVRPNSKCVGYTLYKDAGGYLMYHEMPVTYDDAKRRCAKEGGVLASPISDGIKAAMMNVLLKSSNVTKNVFTGFFSEPHNGGIFSSIEGGVLASPISDGIKAAMMNVLLKSSNVTKNVFTGFFSEPHNGGIFSSIEGVRLSSIEHTWALDDPNNVDGSENCIALSPSGIMSDVNCNAVYPYVCLLREGRLERMDVCSGGYAALDNTTGSCYKLHSNKLGFDEAAKVCEQEGGHLAIINGDAEAQAVKSLLVKHNTKYAILGFQLIKNSRKWMTLQGETIEDAGYATWPEGKNSAASEALKKAFGLIDTDGLLRYSTNPSETRPFICEKDPEIVVCE